MIEQNITHTQTQTLKLSPRLYQSLKMMPLPIQELRTYIQEEVEKNPALEVTADQSIVSLEVAKQSDEYISRQEYSSDPPNPSKQREDHRIREFIEGVLTRSETLHEHLLWQLRLQPLNQVEFGIGNILIDNLDTNGFHKTAPEKIIPAHHHPLLNRIISIIQRFDPIGCCTADYYASLCIQIELSSNLPPYAQEIITTHFSELQHEQYDRIAHSMGITRQNVEAVRAFIHTLEPMPGRAFSNEQTLYVIPDLQFKIENEELIILLNDEIIPSLNVSQFYNELIHTSQSRAQNARKFALNNVREAQWFIDTIRRRNETLLKVATVIGMHQRDFFVHGPSALKPLTLRDVASEVGLHETTISRITTEKYAQTEWGIFNLKFFFSNAIPLYDTHTGTPHQSLSQEAVKAIIQEIRKNHQGGTLSDQKITDMLQKRGISIARRTVTKYRTAMDTSK